MTQINWVRATFTGAMLGGFVWAVIIAIASSDTPEIPWGARALTVAVVVNAVLLVVSWLLWRREAKRTLAAALWIVPFVGVAFLAAMLTIGMGFGALRGS
ncbi:hypothetical protein [Mycolicibacterium sp. 120270]|uniref:hypothetical protein n=1 Tax=Mycolicibacterium sp. 120270 TaxID=3090600 RepID=UPI00299F0FEA|nr:hypothetical protein [Mycolicibacterium sp. 120270]MDX1884713.1 hypothetical protein [Mycolicibacterium sp. 120270]